MTRYRYLPEANPGGTPIPGVPLRDLSDADLADMPEHLRRAVATCRFYAAMEAPPPRRARATTTTTTTTAEEDSADG